MNGWQSSARRRMGKWTDCERGTWAHEQPEKKERKGREAGRNGRRTDPWWRSAISTSVLWCCSVLLVNTFSTRCDVLSGPVSECASETNAAASSEVRYPDKGSRLRYSLLFWRTFRWWCWRQIDGKHLHAGLNWSALIPVWGVHYFISSGLIFHESPSFRLILVTLSANAFTVKSLKAEGNKRDTQ